MSVAMPEATLVQQAMAVPRSQRRPGRYSRQEIDLAVAWARRTVTFQSVQKVMGYKHSSSVYSFLAMALRQAIEDWDRAAEDKNW